MIITCAVKGWLMAPYVAMFVWKGGEGGREERGRGEGGGREERRRGGKEEREMGEGK